jgi:hypothetical protein
VIALASLIERFEAACIAQYRHALLPGHRQATLFVVPHR